MKISCLRFAFSGLFSLFTLLGYGQASTNAPVFRVGFKVIRAVDSTRVFKPNSPPTDYLHYRPVDIDMWYPAQANQSGAALAFRDFIGLLEKRANYYTASTAHAGLTTQIAQSFSELFKCSDTGRVLAFKTRSFQEAPPVKGKFPLVVYLASYNGMGYENIQLFENLASKGFIVISINSNGRYPGNMTMKKEDLLEQVRDATYAVSLVAKDPHVDVSKTGIVGYSWGGLAGALLANRLATPACLVSLDGSEFHHYSAAKQEDEDFDGIKNSSEFKAMRLPVPYLRLQSAPAVTSKPEVVYNFSEKLSAHKTLLTVKAATHQDFSCLPMLVRLSGGCQEDGKYSTITQLTTRFLSDHLKEEKGFLSLLQYELNKTVMKL